MRPVGLVLSTILAGTEPKHPAPRVMIALTSWIKTITR
jgi:hypothetical protein